MEPRIEMLTEKKLVGTRMLMSFANNKTAQLWRSFMPKHTEIKNTVGEELFSVEIYPPNHFINFDPTREFEKWAAVEVTDFDTMPDDMEPLTVPSGLYAVFTYIGPASEGAKMYTYFFETWLPSSEFLLENRPNFAVMGEKYKGEAPDSEEEIWFPIKQKNKAT